MTYLPTLTYELIAPVYSLHLYTDTPAMYFDGQMMVQQDSIDLHDFVQPPQSF